jgi:hypothetical protein
MVEVNCFYQVIIYVEISHSQMVSETKTYSGWLTISFLSILSIPGID